MPWLNQIVTFWSFLIYSSSQKVKNSEPSQNLRSCSTYTSEIIFDLHKFKFFYKSPETQWHEKKHKKTPPNHRQIKSFLCHRLHHFCIYFFCFLFHFLETPSQGLTTSSRWVRDWKCKKIQIKKIKKKVFFSDHEEEGNYFRRLFRGGLNE